MQRLQTAYTVWFNRKHQRSGHLFQGRYGASVVSEDEYILKLSRYVHLNPVFIADHAEKSNQERIAVLRSYAWSSYRSYVGLTKPLDFVTYKPVLTMMDKHQKRQASVYHRFVESGIKDIDAAFIDAKRRSRFCIGSEEYLAEVAVQHKALAAACEHQEDLCFQHTVCHHSVEEVLNAVANVFGVECNALMVRRHDSWLRPLCARALQVYCGLTQREIAKTLSIGSGAAVSKQLRLLGEALTHDRQLQSWWCEISTHLT